MATSSDIPSSNPTRELAAIMFSDIAGYTAIMGRDEQKAVRALAAHRELLRTLLPKFNGRMLGEIGDGTLSSFHSAVDAANCAREIQAALKGDTELSVRIGIHVGDVLFSDNNVLGDGVNVASRIHALADPGGICVSERVYDEIRNKPEMRVRDLGEKRLKNVTRPIRVYALVAPGPPDELPAGRTSRATRRALIAGGGVVLIAALVYGVARWKLFAPISVEQPSTQTRNIRSIAVLPLENFSGDPSQEYFADGMTDELITELATISALRVISRTSVMQFKGEHRKRLPEIAKLLNVDAVVEGSVVRVGDRVRITAQLIDAPADKHLWAKSYERDTRDVLTLQDELASTIARQIDVELTREEQARFAKPRPVNPDALEAVLEGRYFLDRQTGEGYRKAREYYEQAIKIAPDFAGGYVGLAAMYIGAADLVLSNQEAIPKAKEPLETALRLDDANAVAHLLLASIHWSYDYDWIASEREFRRAIELAPGNADIRLGYGLMLGLQGRVDEAEREVKLAQRLDPLSPMSYVAMGQLLDGRGDYPKALEQCRKALEIDPNLWPAYSSCLGPGYDRMGNHGQALKAFEKGVAIEPGPLPIAALGVEYARSGNREQARKAIEQLNRLPSQTYVAPCWRALVYLALGENNTTLDLLEKAYQERSGCVAVLKVPPDFDPLRSEPRFIALLKKVGLDK